MDTEKKIAWLERVEDIINILEGSSVSELELVEGGTEITIRRSPAMVLTPVLVQPGEVVKEGPSGGAGRTVDKSIPIIAPLTGVYYAAASPTSPSFVNIGDVVHMGQVIALIEAMKVFNEVSAEVAGRVVALVATNGNVVQKGDVLLRVEPV